MIVCDKCGNKNLNFEKHIFRPDSDKPLFHITVECNDCKRKKFIKRTKETYELTKDKKWIYHRKKRKSNLELMKNFKLKL
ncbi:MAG: hypothetical protein AABY22_25185 [Nanoarchaeota archaeon]